MGVLEDAEVVDEAVEEEEEVVEDGDTEVLMERGRAEESSEGADAISERVRPEDEDAVPAEEGAADLASAEARAVCVRKAIKPKNRCDV
jgi:hypothetical protein